MPLIQVSPVFAATPTVVKTTLPPHFGIDVGPAKWSFGATKFSWASGSSNMTLNLPSLVVNVAGVNCNPTFSTTLSKNASFYTWTLTSASALLCNGASVTPVLKVMVGNTSAYNQKEVFLSVKTTKLVSSSLLVTNKINAGFISPNSVSVCDSTGGPIPCTMQCIGNTCFDWTSVASSTTYNNATKTISSSCPALSSQTISCTFDPLALDGKNGCNSGTHSCLVGALTTANSPDAIVCIGEFSNAGTSPKFSSTNLGTFTQRKAAVHAGTNSIWGFEAFAIASGTLSSERINFTTTSATTTSAICFGVSGASTATNNGFDPNGGLPYSAGSTTTSAPSVTGVSTTNAVDFVFSLVAEAGTGQNGVPSGFTNICNSATGGACATTQGTRTAAAYEITAAALSGVTITWPSSPTAWVCFVDALTATVAYTFTLSETVSASPSVANNVMHQVDATVSITPSIQKIGVELVSATVSLSESIQNNVNHLVGVTVSIAPHAACLYNFNNCAPILGTFGEPTNYLWLLLIPLFMVVMLIVRKKV